MFRKICSNASHELIMSIRVGNYFDLFIPKREGNDNFKEDY